MASMASTVLLCSDMSAAGQHSERHPVDALLVILEIPFPKIACLHAVPIQNRLRSRVRLYEKCFLPECRSHPEDPVTGA